MPYARFALCPMPYAHEYLIFLRKAIGRFSYVEWISEPANLSQTGFTQDEFIQLCQLVPKRFE
jgi:hypothetical protein